MHRCFIALNLPKEIKNEFAKIQADLKQKNQDIKIVWVNPQIAHINLHFLGDLDENSLRYLKTNLGALEGKFGPISMALTGIGSFPNLKMPKILFLGVKHKGENNLIKLYRELGKILEKQRLSVNNRPFIAHITLGRIKDKNKIVKSTDIEVNHLEFKASSFELMESMLTSNGPRYKIIKSYKL